MPGHWILTWPEVAVLDANAAACGIELCDLMQAAGIAVANEVCTIISLSKRIDHVLILCGPGNNGGDGFVVAQELSERGVPVTIIASHDSQSTSLSEQQRLLCFKHEIQIFTWPETPSLSGSTLVVDALVGVGASGPGSPPRGNIAQILDWAACNPSLTEIVACDIPTVLGHPSSLSASLTVTFHAEKEGMRDVHGDYVAEVGRVVVVPLPWPSSVVDCGPGDALRLPPLDPLAEKGDRGRLLIIGGGPYHGAPLFSGSAAMRTGCDLVHVAMPVSASQRASWPPHLIPEPIPDQNHLSVHSVEVLVNRMSSGRGCQAILIGPGLGQNLETLEAVSHIIEHASQLKIPVVIDADGIAALPIQTWPQGVNGIVTPHSKEAQKWLGSEPDVIQSSLDECRNPEGRVVIITGPEDRLIGPNGRECHARGGHPRMSVGGTGDLLSGICAGLLAQGMAPWPAARLGCAVLRAAGAAAAKTKGVGLLADDVPIYIAEVLMSWSTE